MPDHPTTIHLPFFDFEIKFDTMTMTSCSNTTIVIAIVDGGLVEQASE